MDLDQPIYDVAIVGGGVMGCAILRELSSKGYKCILLEKNSELLCGASGGNSGHIVQSYGSDSSSIESRLLSRSFAMNNCFYTKNKLPFKRFHGIILAMTEKQLEKLPAIVDQSHKNGVLGVKHLGREELFRLEPHISEKALGGVLIPEECSVDPFLSPITMLHEARRLGAQVKRECEVTSGRQLNDKTWELHTKQGIVKSKIVVNAAGLYGDLVENICRPSKFKIVPGKGEAVVYSKSTRNIINHMILQVPTEKSKGVIIYPTVYGNTIIGPTYELVSDREIPSANPKTLEQLIKYGEEIFPELRNFQPIGSVVGLRPGTEQRDYQLEALPERRWVTVAGIRSTGLTNCLPIAEFVSDQILTKIRLPPSSDPVYSPGKAEWWKTKKGTIVMDGAEYTVSHPITKFGLWDSDNPGRTAKSKL